jgi:hypothetical protein
MFVHSKKLSTEENKMEYFVGIIMVIATITLIIFYKGMIKKSAKYCEDAITVNIAEANVDLIRRSTEIAETMKDEFGDDFVTPDEIYNRLAKKKKKTIHKQS